MKQLGRLAPLLLFAALLYVSAMPAGPLPPLGPLLDPANGIWAVASTARLPSAAIGHMAELGDSVRVQYDRRGVPHIFARSRLDATRALGFVVARDRLFQLEIQTRAAAGTLTELVGPVALGVDRTARRLGLAWSAERAWAAVDTTSESFQMAVAFSAGVNALVDRLRRRDYPVEYHLLGAKPMRAEPVHSLYLHRRMGYTLTYTRGIELRRDRLIELVGERAAEALFPRHAPIVEPIVPGGREYPVFDTSTLPPPETRATTSLHRPPEAESGERRGIGSNNWVVGRSRSATGNPLLAGDPHLELTLPSIWYEVHLVVPDTLDAYGVTIPGLPGVVIGFNRDVAWTFTNTEADVVDFYRETLDDEDEPTRYRIDGTWRPLELRVEEYRDPSGDVIAVDTVYHTLRGPIRREPHGDYSLRWTVHETDSNWEPFSRAMRARSVAELVEAFGGYEAPAQNVAMADRFGSFGIGSPGWYPIRPGGRGDLMLPGSTTTSDWTGRIPDRRRPSVIDPRQGYATSANQEPLDPAVNPPYLGSDWYSPWRAMRINQLLRGNSAVTVDDMRRYQTDPFTVRAELFGPALIAAGRRALAAKPDTMLRRSVELLNEWDRQYSPDGRRAVLFEMVMDDLEQRTWDELVDPDSDRRVGTPAEAVLWRLMQDPRSPWWDRRETEAVELRDDVIAQSLRAGLERALDRHGPPDSDGWRWDHVQTANIYHLLFVPTFSALDLPIRGGPGALNPSSGRGTFGASWRMVVELGDTVRAWTTYPGGQSGNPVSPWYDDRLPDWLAGDLDAAIVPRSVTAMAAETVTSRLTLVPERR